MALSDSVTSATVEVGPFAFRVFLGRHRIDSQNNLKILKDFFALRRVLGSNWRLSGSKNHSLGCVFFFFSGLGLFCFLRRTGRRTGDLGRAALIIIYLFGNSVSLGGRRVWKARCTDCWGIVDILCSPKGRGGLNPNLVKGRIPHLEAVCSIYP